MIIDRCSTRLGVSDASPLDVLLVMGVPPLDAVGFIALAAPLFGVALIATYLPARQAGLTEPARALRAD